jgi:hypothetical protein
MKKYLLIWAGANFFLYLFVAGIKYPNAAENVSGVAVISLIIMLIMLGKTWKGEIIKIQTEEKHYADDDGPGETLDIEYAYIKLTNGKTKKIKNKGWKVGDKLEKKRGQFQPQLISKKL